MDRFEFPPSDIEFFVKDENGAEKPVCIDVVEASMMLDDASDGSLSDREFIKALAQWVQEEHGVKLPFGHAWTLAIAIRAAMVEFKKKLPSLVQSHLTTNLTRQPLPEGHSGP